MPLARFPLSVSVKEGRRPAKEEIMKNFSVRMLSALMRIALFGVTPSLAKQEGKAKGKSTETTVKENSGRQAGELPSGWQKYIEKKGRPPSWITEDEGRRRVVD